MYCHSTNSASGGGGVACIVTLQTLLVGEGGIACIVTLQTLLVGEGVQQVLSLYKLC